MSGLSTPSLADLLRERGAPDAGEIEKRIGRVTREVRALEIELTKIPASCEIARGEICSTLARGYTMLAASRLSLDEARSAEMLAPKSPLKIAGGLS